MKCKQILHPATDEMSFKGFIVSKLFTGIMSHISTVNNKAVLSRDEDGQSNAASALQLFAVSLCGSLF